MKRKHEIEDPFVFEGANPHSLQLVLSFEHTSPPIWLTNESSWFNSISFVYVLLIEQYWQGKWMLGYGVRGRVAGWAVRERGRGLVFLNFSFYIIISLHTCIYFVVPRFFYVFQSIFSIFPLGLIFSINFFTYIYIYIFLITRLFWTHFMIRKHMIFYRPHSLRRWTHNNRIHGGGSISLKKKSISVYCTAPSNSMMALRSTSSLFRHCCSITVKRPKHVYSFPFFSSQKDVIFNFL